MMSRVQIQPNSTPQSEDTSWANAKPDGEPQYHGWGKPDPNPATGWGAPTATGWGSGQPQSSVDNGTAVWGNSKTVQDQGSGWGGHQVGNSLTSASNPPNSSAQTTDTPTVQPQQATKDASSSIVTTNVDSTASSVATSTVAKKSIAITDEKVPVVTNSNEPLAPVSVANPSDNPPPSVPPASTEPADPVQQYVNSHEGWGKTPIQQNGSWDHVEDAFKQPHIPRGGPGRYEHISNGTEAWGKPSTGQMPPAGGNWGEPKKHSNSHYHNNYQGHNNNNWGVNQPGYGPSQYGGNWNDQRSNQPNNDRWGGDQQGHQGGWNGPSSVNQSKGNWGNHMNDNNRNWNMGRGNQNSFNPSGSNNWDNQPPMQDWNRGNDMSMGPRRPVDDGTRLWGDPNSYDNVQLWDNRRGPNMDMNAPNNNAKGWGGAGGMPPNNQGKGWGDGPSRPIVDNGTQVWRKQNQPQPLDKGSDWMKHNQDNQVWNSKPSNGGWGQSNDYNDGTSGWGGKSFQNKSAMEYNNMRSGMNRPSHQQQQPPPIAPLPPSPQLNQQFQQAVMQGLIPTAALHPNLMVDARHMQSLVQLLQKQNELNQFQNRMGKGLRNQDDVMRFQRIQNQFDLARNQVLQSTQSFNNKPNVNKNMDISSMRQQQLPNMGNAVPNLGQSGPGNAGWKQPKDNKMYGTGNDANPRMNPNNPYSGYMMPQDQQQMGQDPKMMENSLVGKSDFNNMDGNHPSKEMTNNNNSPLADIGPPEFTPGVPWPGLRPIDPENDPTITPGSVSKQISVVNKVSDTDQLLKRDRGGALSDSSGNGTNGNAVNGILNENSEVFPQPNNQQQDRYNNHHHQQQQGCWLVLTNFTPGVDVEAVRELCARHGTVMTFQAHNPIENMALVRYSNQEEAKAAKAALHIKRVGPTMLLASVSTDQEVENFHSASNGSALYPSSAGGAAPNANSRFTQMSNSSGGASNGSSGNFISPQQQQQANHHQQQQQQRNPMQERIMSPVNHQQQPNNYVWSTQPSQAWAGAGGGPAPHQQAWSAGGGGNTSQNLIDDNMHSYLPENLLVNEM